MSSEIKISFTPLENKRGHRSRIEASHITIPMMVGAVEHLARTVVQMFNETEGKDACEVVVDKLMKVTDPGTAAYIFSMYLDQDEAEQPETVSKHSDSTDPIKNHQWKSSSAVEDNSAMQEFIRTFLK